MDQYTIMIVLLYSGDNVLRDSPVRYCIQNDFEADELKIYSRSTIADVKSS
jgi:hypothetical protein